MDNISLNNPFNGQAALAYLQNAQQIESFELKEVKEYLTEGAISKAWETSLVSLDSFFYGKIDLDEAIPICVDRKCSIIRHEVLAQAIAFFLHALLDLVKQAKREKQNG